MSTDARPEVIKVTDETTRAEIEEALGWANQTAKRVPAHWLDHKARAHAKLNALLDDWENACP